MSDNRTKQAPWAFEERGRYTVPGQSGIPDVMPAAPPFSVVILTESTDADAVLAHARDTLNAFGVPFVEATLSARDHLADQVAAFESAGGLIFIAANTSAAGPLATAVAGLTTRPVLAVPVETPDVGALEALRASSVAGGPPVGTLAVGKAGAINAALLAVAILGNTDAALRAKLRQFREEQTAKVLAAQLE
jgi:5-(carboxyamino)imidazole ribonucleotide mutase